MQQPLQQLITPEYFWPDIINDLKRLLDSKEGFDVIIYVGKEPNIREFYAHSLILECRSQLFSTDLIEKKNEFFTFRIPNIPSNCFHRILSYIYCGDIDLKNCTSDEILNIIVVASDFGLHKLVQHLKEILFANRKEILRNGNPLECLTLSFNHESLSSFRDTLIQLVCQEPGLIFGTRSFYSLTPNTLETLIKREDLVLDEIIIWENLVKWCIYQRKGFENYDDDFRKNLSDEEVDDIKELLERYIYLINFGEISAQEYLNKVMPYEEFLSKDLKKEIIRSYMFAGKSENVPNIPRPLTKSLSVQRKFSVQIDSNLINHLHVALIAAWIDKKPEMYNNSKLIHYEFNLLFRSTRDGTDCKSFHGRCDNQGPTIIIAKIKDSKQLIGGYNPLGWEGDCIKSTTDSFLFSFDDRNRIDTGKIGRVIKPKDAIRCFKGWGPIFGDLNGDSNDLVMTSVGYWSSSSGSYEDVGIPSQFKVEEWEVFQIKKKKHHILRVRK